MKLKILTKHLNGTETIEERDETEEEIAEREAREAETTKRNRIQEIQSRLTELTQDFVQDQCGEIIDDLSDRKTEFVTLHNELRVLLGKEKREIVNNN